MEFTKVGEGKLNKSSLNRKDGAKLNHTNVSPQTASNPSLTVQCSSLIPAVRCLCGLEAQQAKLKSKTPCPMLMLVTYMLLQTPSSLTHTHTHTEIPAENNASSGTSDLPEGRC